MCGRSSHNLGETRDTQHQFGLALVGALIVPLAAQANPTCTTEAKKNWMSEDAIKARIAALTRFTAPTKKTN
jgi:hypothetical protein